jgi:hypothetical protein
MNGDSGRRMDGAPELSDEMLSVLLRSVMARGAETAQQAHHVVIMFRRRRADAKNPVEQIWVGAFEQSFESVELRAVEARERRLREGAENEIALLRSAMPAAEQEPTAADIEMLAL